MCSWASCVVMCCSVVRWFVTILVYSWAFLALSLSLVHTHTDKDAHWLRVRDSIDVLMGVPGSAPSDTDPSTKGLKEKVTNVGKKK